MYCDYSIADEILGCMYKEGNKLLYEAYLRTPRHSTLSMDFDKWRHDFLAEKEASLVKYLCQNRKDLPSCDKFREKLGR